MKLFLDKELKQEVKEIDFGIVEIGTSKELTLYVLNDSTAHLRNLEFKVDREDVQVIYGPSELPSGKIGILKLKWTPGLKLQKALRVNLIIKGEEVYSLNG